MKQKQRRLDWQNKDGMYLQLTSLAHTSSTYTFFGLADCKHVPRHLTIP